MREIPVVPVEWLVGDGQQAQLEPHLRVALAVLPHWVSSMSVRYDPGLSGALCKVTTLPEYRTVHVQVGDPWFAEGPYERTVALLHELVHAHLAALSATYDHMLEALLPEGANPALRVWAQRQQRHAEECTVTDLSRLMAGLLVGPPTGYVVQQGQVLPHGKP